MTFRLLGLPEEDRLAIEEASGGTIDTEAARIIIERSVQQAEELTRAAIREVQEVIGPHGSVTRLQAGGVRITPGAGIGVFTDGVAKTNIQNNGTLVIGSDITNPTTTTEVFFTEDTIYNNEQFLAGDFLIGDNTTGSSNIKFSALNGQLQFRGGQTVQAYMDTDGSIKAGGGDVTIDETGIWVENQQAAIGFKDTNGDIGNIYLSSKADDFIGLDNRIIGAGIRLTIKLTDGTFPVLEWKENPSADNETYVNINPGAAGGRVAFGNDHFIDFHAGTPSGTKTVTFNERGADIDFVIEGDTDATLFKVDASEDAVYIKGLKITGAWASFSPTATNLTLGTGGTLTGKYIQIGKTVHYIVDIVLGTSCAVGVVHLDFPVIAVTMNSDAKVGDLTMRDVSPGASYVGIAGWASTTQMLLRGFSVSGTAIGLLNLSSTSPFTWAAGDLISVTGTYEAA